MNETKQLRTELAALREEIIKLRQELHHVHSCHRDWWAPWVGNTSTVAVPNTTTYSIPVTFGTEA